MSEPTPKVRLSFKQAAWLLHDLCVDYGFCLPSAEAERLRLDPPTDVDAFTDAVFVAEGLPPREHRVHLLVRERVAKAFRAAASTSPT